MEVSTTSGKEDSVLLIPFTWAKNLFGDWIICYGKIKKCEDNKRSKRITSILLDILWWYY